LCINVGGKVGAPTMVTKKSNDGLKKIGHQLNRDSLGIWTTLNSIMLQLIKWKEQKS
jgi:hypothetical protein